MASPFDIDEIYPDDGDHPLRLPRRQVGNSPQGVAVTLLADYTLRTRVGLPSGAIVALLAETGVTTAGRVPRSAGWPVVASWRAAAGDGTAPTGSAGRPPPTSPQVVTGSSAPPVRRRGGTGAGRSSPSLPQELSTQRRALRAQLRWLGYAPLYDGLWISPHDLTPPARAQLDQLTLGAVTVFRGRQTMLDSATDRAPIEAWDIQAISRSYEAFLRRWTPLLPEVVSGRVDGVAAVRARTEIMDTFRRFPVLDPQLPVELLPQGGFGGRHGNCSGPSTTASPRRPNDTSGLSSRGSSTPCSPASGPTPPPTSSPDYAPTRTRRCRLRMARPPDAREPRGAGGRRRLTTVSDNRVAVRHRPSSTAVRLVHWSRAG
ncbi:PaaX family transcriptional regulator C-terminal domain-containing protein [Micromonospora sp. M12]